MKKLVCLMGSVMLIMNTYGQRDVDMFMIGRNVPDILLSRVLNYKDSTTPLTSFGEKLIIFQFWDVNCNQSANLVSKMDSIQRDLNDKVQFVLITSGSKHPVEVFLKTWNERHSTKLSIPIVYGEAALLQLFPHQGTPHTVFIRPDGHLLIQSSEELILNKDLINAIAVISIKRINEQKAAGNNIYTYKMKPANKALLKRLKENKWVQQKFIY